MIKPLKILHVWSRSLAACAVEQAHGEYFLGIDMLAFASFIHRLLKRNAKHVDSAQVKYHEKVKALSEALGENLNHFTWFDFVPQEIVDELESPEAHTRKTDQLVNESGIAAFFQPEEDGLYALGIWPDSFREYMVKIIKRRVDSGVIQRLSTCPAILATFVDNYLSDRQDLYEWYQKFPEELIQEMKDALLERAVPSGSRQDTPNAVPAAVEQPPLRVEPQAPTPMNLAATQAQSSPQGGGSSQQTIQPGKTGVSSTPPGIDSQDLFSTAELHLSRFSINRTGTGYYSLKSGRSNVAIWRYVRNRGYILGSRKYGLAHMIPVKLTHAQSFGQQCPIEFIPMFSPHGGLDWPHQSYDWFLIPDVDSLYTAIRLLDT